MCDKIELPIGARFRFYPFIKRESVLVEVVKNDAGFCKGCAIYGLVCGRLQCNEKFRSDKTSVIYKRVEEGADTPPMKE